MTEEKKTKVKGKGSTNAKKEITTIRDLVLAVVAKHGLDAVHMWDANLQAEAMNDSKKWELVELILEGTKPITDTTFEEYVVEMEARHDNLQEAAEELGDLAEGLLPEPPKVKRHGGWHDGPWYCPYCGIRLLLLSSSVCTETCKTTGVLNAFTDTYCVECKRDLSMTVFGVEAEAGPGTEIKEV